MYIEDKKNMSIKHVYNAIVEKDTYKTILEVSDRKKARRLARKKYHKEYSEKKTYIIISGSDKKNAISLYKNSLEDVAKKKTSSQSATKKKDKNIKEKSETKKKETKKAKKNAESKRNGRQLSDDLFIDEKKNIERMNKRNMRDDSGLVFGK